MVREKNPAWEAHTSHFGPSGKANKSYDWVCKYCGKATSTGLTRFQEHLAKVGGNIAPCPGVPQAVADEIFRSIQSNPRRKRNFIDIDDTISSQHSAPRAAAPMGASSSPAASTMGGASSTAEGEMETAGPARRAVNVKHVRQASLTEASGGTIQVRSHIKKLQHEAESEIARTVIECNLSFHVLKAKQWKKMVVAIAKAGYQEGWTGLSYNEMRDKKLVEEKSLIDRQLDPVRAGWAKYGCSILSDGWSDRKKRGLINILVSSPLGTYFLRAIDSARCGKKTSAEFIYSHIKLAINEVNFT